MTSLAGANPSSACDPVKFHIHPNGGGQVSDCARVDSTAFIDNSTLTEVVVESTWDANGNRIEPATVDNCVLSHTTVPVGEKLDNQN